MNKLGQLRLRRSLPEHRGIGLTAAGLKVLRLFLASTEAIDVVDEARISATCRATLNRSLAQATPQPKSAIGRE
jgi:hypothetical protein